MKAIPFEQVSLYMLNNLTTHDIVLTDAAEDHAWMCMWQEEPPQ